MDGAFRSDELHTLRLGDVTVHEEDGRVPTETVEDLTATTPDGGRFQEYTGRPLAATQDEVLDEVDALALRIQQLLDERGDVDAILRGLR